MLFFDLVDGCPGDDFLRVDDKIRAGQGKFFRTHRIDRPCDYLGKGIPFFYREHGRKVCRRIAGHHKCDLKGGQAHEHIRRGDVPDIGIGFLVAEVADPGFVFVDHYHALMFLVELKNDVVAVRAAAKNAVFYRFC